MNDAANNNTTQTEATMANLSKGDKIRTIYGKIEEVMAVYPSQIITYESDAEGSWHHPSKVWKVEE